MMNDERLLSLLGLAQKAGKIVSGEMAVEKAIRNRSAKLLLVAADASESTKKNYQDMAAYYSTPIFILLTKDQLGVSIGKISRAALAVTDTGFNKAILKLLTM
ncbi:MAG: ribosomal protein L7Ae/L30e/S12e/Gadd45 [Firmicutes bacterium]|nr:ribosomal protein L7Ae/L30e/S12e/Gadd45 [Bacillota bacterium]